MPRLIPPERLIVRLLIAGVVLNKKSSNVRASVPPKFNEETELRFKYPASLVIVPFNSKVVFPTIKSPKNRFKLLFTVIGDMRVTLT